MAYAETTAGRVRGTEEGGTQVFRGIPYAAPPVGSRRFAPPEPMPRWKGERDAVEFGPISHQASIGLPMMGGDGQPQSEDCLYLNVWTPSTTGSRPVMVWIHGGAFVFGAGSDALYDGRRLAASQDVVVVTVNYRLGALGYLAHPALRNERTGACGNWGLLDQIAAVRWVRDNAAAFGGDPDNITIFGESAGSMSVTTMMGAPAAKGLFGRVIGQSGAPMVAAPEEAQDTAERLLSAAGIGAAALRGAPAAQILEAQQRVMTEAAAGGLGARPNGEAMPFRPTLDGAVLARHPVDAVAEGHAAGVSLLTGTNRDEMKLFAMLDQAELDDDAVVERLAEGGAGGEEAARIVAVYRDARTRRGEPIEAKELWTAIETDRFFRTAAHRLAAAHARHEPSTYSYLFCWSSPMPMLGAAHAVEVPFVFGTLDAPMIDMFAGSGPGAERLSSRMQEAWAAFARDGQPSVRGADRWPAFGEASRGVMVIGDDWTVEANPRGAELDCWLPRTSVA